jgi:hypothetical protein
MYAPVMAVLIAGALAASPAGAVTIEQLTQVEGRTVTAVHLVEAVTPVRNTASVVVSPPIADCPAGAVSYETRTDIGKAIHGSLLTAKASGTRVSIGYERIALGYVVDCRLRTLKLE